MLILFMLVSALMGLEKMRAAYAHAIDYGYRFYSYGDASLLLRSGISAEGPAGHPVGSGNVHCGWSARLAAVAAPA